MGFSDLDDGVDDVVALRPLVVGDHVSAISVDRFAPTVLSREEARGQSEIGHHPHAELGSSLSPAARAFDIVAMEEVVMGLQDDGPGAALGIGDSEPLPDALGRVVRQSHISDLAGSSGLFEGGDSLLKRGGLVIEMGIVDVDGLGAQTRQ